MLNPIKAPRRLVARTHKGPAPIFTAAPVCPVAVAATLEVPVPVVATVVVGVANAVAA